MLWLPEGIRPLICLCRMPSTITRKCLGVSRHLIEVVAPDIKIIHRCGPACGNAISFRATAFRPTSPRRVSLDGADSKGAMGPFPLALQRNGEQTMRLQALPPGSSNMWVAPGTTSSRFSQEIHAAARALRLTTTGSASPYDHPQRRSQAAERVNTGQVNTSASGHHGVDTCSSALSGKPDKARGKPDSRLSPA